MIFFSTQCTNVWDYTVLYCGGACYTYIQSLITFDWLFNYGFLILIIVISNTALFTRFIWRKASRQQPIQWRRHRRLIIQLIFISSLFLIFGVPSTLVAIIEVLWLPTFLLDIEYNYLTYISVYGNQLYPFVIIGSLPEIQKDLKKWIGRIRRFFLDQGQVHPFQTSVNQ
ncbi:unnamed protein product [Adineta steineri]|uniref:Uncharacterized protein n=1 Tax=Adineta steineri TaxID=433720 RepID=A0A814YYG3_9BILA|nr:unnamed protein product [Adineta steineri]CAF1243718.1 unnamed protein product [Adineta steineri]CAF1263434.1 unnamed protein product [Adineta steineri]